MLMTLDTKYAHFELPAGVESRLHWLLDRQDSGIPLTDAEREEAEGLVEIVEFLSLLRLRATRFEQENQD